MNIEGLNFVKKAPKAGKGVSDAVDISVTLQGNKMALAASFSKTAYTI